MAVDTPDLKHPWESEEFEDWLARALLVSYEEKVYPPPPPHRAGKFESWFLPQHHYPTRHHLTCMRRGGLYIPSPDRYILDEGFWPDLDGVPEYASLALYSTHHTGLDSMRRGSYFETYLAQRIKQWPHSCKMIPGIYIGKYRFIELYAKDDGIEAHVDYFGLKTNGQIVPELGGGAGNRKAVRQYGSATLQYYTDRRFIWNVEAQDGVARATLGVHPAQIKSLFYARSLPLTGTGRKRPILHWVSAHRRRLKEGIEIDIDKHLRGIDRFVYKGTQFVITRPVKPNQRKQSCQSQ